MNILKCIIRPSNLQIASTKNTKAFAHFIFLGSSTKQLTLHVSIYLSSAFFSKLPRNLIRSLHKKTIKGIKAQGKPWALFYAATPPQAVWVLNVKIKH